MSQHKASTLMATVPPIKPLYRGVFIFFVGILIAFLGGNGLMLLIGIGVMFYGGFVAMPDAWVLYQKFKKIQAQDKRDVKHINPIVVLPREDIPPVEPKQEAYFSDGVWKTRRLK